MFRIPVPRQQSQYAELFKRILSTSPPDKLLNGFFTLARDHSYLEYRLNLSRSVDLSKDLCANIADHELLWYGTWDLVTDFWFRSLGLHVIPQYPLWRLKDGGSHPKVDERGKKSVSNWRENAQAETRSTPSPSQEQLGSDPAQFSFLFDLSSSVSVDVGSHDDSPFDLSLADIPPVKPSKERLTEIELENILRLDTLNIDDPDRSQVSDSASQLSPSRTAEISLPAIIRERGDNSLVADFACVTLQGIRMRDVFGADGAPPPNAYPSSQEEHDRTMNEELTTLIDGLRRRVEDSHVKNGPRLGKHLDLARVLVLLEAKRHARTPRDIAAALLESIKQVEQQACYCFDMPDIVHLVAIATSGDTWRWAILRKSKTSTRKDKKGRDMADFEFEKAWSKEFLLETQESEDQWLLVVQVVSDLLEEAEVDVML